eukprot:scaffold10980_cov81-Cyclotella_meneghiniana.AAC.1
MLPSTTSDEPKHHFGCTPQLTWALCHRNDLMASITKCRPRSVDLTLDLPTLDLIKVSTTKCRPGSVDPTLDLIEVSTRHLTSSKCRPQSVDLKVSNSKCRPQSVDLKVLTSTLDLIEVSTTKCPSGKSVTVTNMWLVFMWCILQY